MLSFASAEYFAPQSAAEITFYSGDDNFIGCRNAADDRVDMLPAEINIPVPPLLRGITCSDVLPALQQSYSLHYIRGPPALASLI